MYVLHEVLGLAEDQQIAPMDAKRGSLLLVEMLQGGNFGHHAIVEYNRHTYIVVLLRWMR